MKMKCEGCKKEFSDFDLMEVMVSVSDYRRFETGARSRLFVKMRLCGECESAVADAIRKAVEKTKEAL